MSFELGAGFWGDGTILAGEVLLPSAIDSLLSTSGLIGNSKECDLSAVTGSAPITMEFRSSSDPFSGTITLTNNSGRCCTTRLYDNSYIANNSRFQLTLYQAVGGQQHWNFYSCHLNSSLTSTKTLIQSQNYPEYPPGGAILGLFRYATSWRFLARDHATALIHYSDTDEEGSVFAASCVNSATQWGLWIAGEVGDRSAYFNQTQGYFAIVLLVNGATTYFSAFSPAGENSTSRNDAPFRHFNIVPKAGQSTTEDNISELLILRDLGSFESAYIGKVPGFFYVDPNKAGFDNYTIGEQLDIDPVTNASFEGRDRALIVGRWGADQALTASSTGALFTITSASPNRRTLENGRRIQLTTIAPTGMAINTNYWVINWNTTNFTFNLATIEGGSAITPTSDETGMAITAKAALLAMRCY